MYANFQLRHLVRLPEMPISGFTENVLWRYLLLVFPQDLSIRVKFPKLEWWELFSNSLTGPEFGISSGVSSLVGWKWANMKQNSAKLHFDSFSTGINKSTILSASGLTANSGIASKSSRLRKLFDSRSNWTNLNENFIDITMEIRGAPVINFLNLWFCEASQFWYRCCFLFRYICRLRIPHFWNYFQGLRYLITIYMLSVFIQVKLFDFLHLKTVWWLYDRTY